jgi:hypothetical protein
LVLLSNQRPEFCKIASVPVRPPDAVQADDSCSKALAETVGEGRFPGTGASKDHDATHTHRREL